MKLSQSLGIITEENIFIPLLLKGAEVPCTNTLTFATTEENQQEADIIIFQGERAQALKNKRLGEIKLKNLKKTVRSGIAILLTFTVENENLYVSTKNPSTNEKYDLSIPLNQDLELKISENDIQEDMKFQEIAETRYSIKRQIEISEKLLSKIDDDMDIPVREITQTVNQTIRDSREALQKNDISLLTKELKALSNFTEELTISASIHTS